MARQGFPEKSHLRASLQEVGGERATWRRAVWQRPEGASEALEARRTARLEQSKPKGGNEVREVTWARSLGVLWIISTWVFSLTEPEPLEEKNLSRGGGTATSVLTALSSVLLGLP